MFLKFFEAITSLLVGSARPSFMQILGGKIVTPAKSQQSNPPGQVILLIPAQDRNSDKEKGEVTLMMLELYERGRKRFKF